jgi:hypothetical protein
LKTSSSLFDDEADDPTPTTTTTTTTSDPNSFLINVEEEEVPDTLEDIEGIKSFYVDRNNGSSVTTTPPVKPSIKKRCLCKARAECPEEYTDYSFGFGCTYDTVRCCQPEPDSSRLIYIKKSEKAPPIDNLSSEGILAGEADTSNDDDDDDDEPSCYCLPLEQCDRMESNVIWRREDTLCPNDLVKCCGQRSIGALEKSDIEDDNSNINNDDDDEEDAEGETHVLGSQGT